MEIEENTYTCLTKLKVAITNYKASIFCMYLLLMFHVFASKRFLYWKIVLYLLEVQLTNSDKDSVI